MALGAELDICTRWLVLNRKSSLRQNPFIGLPFLPARVAYEYIRQLQCGDDAVARLTHSDGLFLFKCAAWHISSESHPPLSGLGSHARSGIVWGPGRFAGLLHGGDVRRLGNPAGAPALVLTPWRTWGCPTNCKIPLSKV